MSATQNGTRRSAYGAYAAYAAYVDFGPNGTDPGSRAKRGARWAGCHYTRICIAPEPGSRLEEEFAEDLERQLLAPELEDGAAAEPMQAGR